MTPTDSLLRSTYDKTLDITGYYNFLENELGLSGAPLFAAHAIYTAYKDTRIHDTVNFIAILDQCGLRSGYIPPLNIPMGRIEILWRTNTDGANYFETYKNVLKELQQAPANPSDPDLETIRDNVILIISHYDWLKP